MVLFVHVLVLDSYEIPRDVSFVHFYASLIA